MSICSMKSLLVDSFSGEWGTETGEVLTPVLRTANFNEDGSFDYSSPAYRCISEKKVQAKRMRRGDIVLEKSGGTPNRPVGIMAYYDSDDEALCSNFNHVLRFDADSVNSFFMFHQLRWLRERGAFAPYTRKTTGLQNLQMKAFVDLELTVPPRVKQDDVAAAIRAIDSERNELNTLLERLDELVKSRFVEMFGNPVTNSMGWPISTIKETALLYGDGPFGSNLKSSDYVPEGVRVIRLGNILQGAFSEKDRSFVSYEKYESLKRYECKPGQVVIATLGDPLLRACLVPDFGVPSIHKADCMYYETDPEKVLPLFAVNVINHPTMLERAGVDGHGQTRQRINSTQTGNLPMILPPIALQQEFVTFVQQVDKLKFETQQAIEKLQLLYDSLAQEYFGS